MLQEAIYLLNLAEKAQKHYNFLFGKLGESDEEKRYEELKSIIVEMRGEILTVARLAKYELSTHFRTGQQYLADALIAVKPEMRARCIENAFHFFTRVVAEPKSEARQNSWEAQMLFVTSY